MAKKLDKKQKDFCKFKAQGFSNEESAIKAGYAKTTAKTKSYLWLEKSEIKEEIERLQKITQQMADEKFKYDVETSFNKLNQIQELALLPNDKGDYLNLASAIKAEELKGKLYGCYEVDNKQKTAPMTINFARNYD